MLPPKVIPAMLVASAVLLPMRGHAQATVALADSVADSTAAHVVGTAGPDERVTFEVALAVRDRDALIARIHAGTHLATAEFAARHSPDQANYDEVARWLTAQGLTLEPESDTTNRLALRVSGSADAVSRALGVRFSHVVADGKTWVATGDAPRVPAALAAQIAGVNGLQPYQHMTKLTTGLSAHPAKTQAAPNGGVTISGYYFPIGIERAYQAAPYLTESGFGTRTAILIDTYPYSSDVTRFWTEAGITKSVSDIEGVRAVAGTLPAPTGEETIDVDMASGVGYGSKVRVYATLDTKLIDLDAGLRAILSDLTHGVQINQLSISLGLCEPAVARSQIGTDEVLLESIAAHGTTILVASGDSGAQECGAGKGYYPSWYSTSPFVTAVGGTSLVVHAASRTSPFVTIVSETGWSGSGGGISTIYPEPSWQLAAGFKTAGRAVPDIAAVGDPNTGVDIVLNGVDTEYGGTSVATPIWAGFVGWINQARFAAKKPQLGQFGPRIYKLLGTNNFRDTTQGCNGGYCALKGYDLVTGLGSPVMRNLLPTLVAQP